MARSVSLVDYYQFLEPEVIDSLESCRKMLLGASIQHVNSTAYGGGVAELLSSLVPLMESAGLDCKWSVMHADEDFFNVTKKFHNALHGQELVLDRSLLDTYRRGAERNLDLIDSRADFVVIHDLQPLGLVERRKTSRARWIWYCHVDVALAHEELWSYLREYINQFDVAVFHLPEYMHPDLSVRQHTMPPGIDPLSEKNRELEPLEQKALLEKLGIITGRPIVLQVSRFDRLKDPLGVVDAFRLAGFPGAQLILTGGGAADDPEAAEVLTEVEEKTAGDPDIRVLPLAPDSSLEINALQRAAAVVIQKSLREGFGLTVTEALWKAKPVIGSAVGGIRYQIEHGRSGILVRSVEEAASAIRMLLADPRYASDLGKEGKERVRKNFLLPVYLLNWFQLLLSLNTGEYKA